MIISQVSRPMKAFIEHVVTLRLANGETRVVTRKWWKKFLDSLS